MKSKLKWCPVCSEQTVHDDLQCRPCKNNKKEINQLVKVTIKKLRK